MGTCILERDELRLTVRQPWFEDRFVENVQNLINYLNRILSWLLRSVQSNMSVNRSESLKGIEDLGLISLVDHLAPQVQIIQGI